MDADNPTPVGEPEMFVSGVALLTSSDEPVRLPKASRRGFMRTMTAVGIGVALGGLDRLTFGARPAGAAPYEVWETCQGYRHPQTICVPSSAYYGRDNCWPSGPRTFHRDDVVNGSNTLYYFHDGYSCNGRNAWKWYGGTTTSKKAMCSDGYKERYNSDDELTFSSFSICRTPL